MLEAVNLTKSHGPRLALAGLSVKMVPGEVFCLLGPAGSGKTTALDLFLGLTKPTSGAAKLFGVASTMTAQTRSKIAAVPAGYALYPDLTLAENLDFFLNASGLPSLSVGQRYDLLRDCGLEPAMGKRFGRDLTPGQRQITGVAIGLARDARAFLCDEPTGGLDASEAAALGDLLRRVATGQVGGEPSVVLLAASTVEGAACAHRIGLLAKGRLAATLDTRESSDWRSAGARHLEGA